MDTSSSTELNVHDQRVNLHDSPNVVHQLAKYPPTRDGTSLRSGSFVSSAPSQLATKSPESLQPSETPTPRSLQASPKSTKLTGTHQATNMPASPILLPTDSLNPHTRRGSIELAEHRSLPSRVLTDENIDDAYVAFILYCNPYVSSSVDTSALRRSFRLLPRSEGKRFSIFRLWELIRKLDNKEIKSWVQLSIQLGVEPPSAVKRESTQKVTQYAVRLKRWMHAMHIDAFFEYCLGNTHLYFTQLPPVSPLASEIRDGVPAEDDLALKALIPEWRPKRGRKRADEIESIDKMKTTKRPRHISAAVLHRCSSSTQNDDFFRSAIPFSAFPDEDDESGPNDSWTNGATSFSFESSSRDQPACRQGPGIPWRPLSRETSPPGYPQSAILLRDHLATESLCSREPRSAVLPVHGEIKMNRSQRRSGLAVSSAWPKRTDSSLKGQSGKPSITGSVSNGAFSTFSADVSFEISQSADHPRSRTSPAAVGDRVYPKDVSSEVSEVQPHEPGTSQRFIPRPSKLQLQVPLNTGRPVRLVTPPTKLVNEATETFSGRDQIVPHQNKSTSIALATHATDCASRLTYENLVDALCGEILRGKVIGRKVSLAQAEARSIAAFVVEDLIKPFDGTSNASHLYAVAVQLGLGHRLGIRESTSGSYTIKVCGSSIDQKVTSGTGQNGNDASGHIYSVIHERETPSGMLTRLIYGNLTLQDDHSCCPAAVAKVHSNGLEHSAEDLEPLSEAEFEVDTSSNTASEATWKQRYLRLRAQLQKKERSLTQYRRKIMESVMADLE